MAVKIYKDTIQGTFGLMTENKDGSKWVVRAAPNNWKSEKAAIDWARRRGYDVDLGNKKIKSSKRNSRKDKKRAKKLPDNFNFDIYQKVFAKKSVQQKKSSKKKTVKRTIKKAAPKKRK